MAHTKMPFDENRILKEVTLRVAGTLDIGQALVETRGFLSEMMPMDEIMLLRVDENDRGLHLVIRVTGAGVTGEQNQFLFMLGDRKQKLVESHLHSDEKAPGVFVLSQKELNTEQIKEQFRDLGLPECSDVLVLFDSRLLAALVAVSYREKVYNKAHVHLFELLREPFGIALNNAIRYTEVRHMRDTLADDNLLFREATVRLTGEHDIAKAFQNTLLYLRRAIPLRQILVVSMDDRTADQRILLRVSEQSTIDEAQALLFSGTDRRFIQERYRIMDDLPDTFVRRVDRGDFPDMSQEEMADKIRQLGIPKDAAMIMLGVKAARSGILFVCDHISAPGDWRRHIDILQMLKEPFIIALYNAIRFYELERLKNHLEEDNRALRRDMQREAGDRVIGMNLGLKHVMSLVSQVAKTPSPVLLLGETGSGKEVIATAVHRFSNRNAGPFISLNCGAIPESLIDSELFGHERGAFTGAGERKRGRFERADTGTLFLDEVGELPLSAQVRLLRVLQEKEFERIGGNQVIRADVRLIAATNRDLPAMVKDGRFREDLWFRLNVFPLEIPPLRERREDIPALAYHFIETKCRQLNLAFRPALPVASLERLVAYDWPGNVRELQNAIERALILSRGEPLRFPYLIPPGAPEPALPKPQTPASRMPSYDEAVAAYLKSLLESTKGRIAGPKGAAKIAGLNPSTLRSKLKKLGIVAMEE